MSTRGKTIGVWSGSGGAGKSLLAANLAMSLHLQETGRVLLIDAGHPVPGDVTTLLGLDRAKALDEMAPIMAQLTPESLARYLVSTRDGLTAAALTSNVIQARVLSPALVHQMFALATSAFDLVVIDLPPGLAPFTQQILDYCDYACAVAEASPSGLTRARHCLDYLRASHFPDDTVYLCVNRVPSNGGLTPDRIERILGMPVAVALPEDPSTAMASALKGTPLLLAAPRHPIARGIDRLGRDIATRGLRELTSLTAGQAGASSAEHTSDIPEIRRRIHNRLVEEIDLKKADLGYLRDPVKLQELRSRAESKVLALLDEEGAAIRDRDTRRRIVKEVLDEALGLGPLEDFLADADITEIMVNRFDHIYVERHGKLEATEARFLGNEQLRGVIERIVAPLGRRIDERVPMVDARLRDGSRVNAIIPPLAVRGPALTIRKFSKKLLGVTDLTRLGSLTEQMAMFLEAAVHARMNVVISGGTGSGKTTLLNVLSSFIPETERIITIEDSAELQLSQAHVITLESRPPNIEDEGAITIRDLVRNALRMRPDRIVVGECRAGEALDMLQAMNTGHDGSLTTVHANSPRDALSRLETLSLMAGLDLPSKAIRHQIGSAIDVVLQQARLPDGSRRITHITEVTGMEGDAFTCADVFLFRQTGMAPDGTVYGQYVPTGYVPSFIEGLARRGIKVPREIFLHQTA